MYNVKIGNNQVSNNRTVHYNALIERYIVPMMKIYKDYVNMKYEITLKKYKRACVLD